MATYRIAYTDGETETITADYVDPEGVQYVAYLDSKLVAYIPGRNVRSIVRQDDEAVTG